VKYIHGTLIVDYTIKSRSESFCAEIEDRDGVEVGNWAKHKKPSTLNDICYFLQADHKKKIGHELPVDISTLRI
jgi:hypothetical protein